VNFDPIWSFPKPVQAGGPPVLLGSQSKRVFERVAEYCDGWLPINFPRYDFPASVRQLREAEKKAHRQQLSLSMFGAPSKDDEIRRLVDLGFERLIFPLPPAGRETVLPLIENYANVAAKQR